ncbi:MAG: phosphoadenylyl-sulfate reductase [Verrucomicrobiae bacterium]|nr:phosphoadenylyl-sulfate reductase [Verrucomicrobiae bacterium]MCP5539168.1 phosphoadenylyl-sulfate reductase [Akkermansiaceae bacterium]MCP5549819.1 phosphoadenylyl-sulfate reductase [Akkermansiaceae bacterium]
MTALSDQVPVDQAPADPIAVAEGRFGFDLKAINARLESSPPEDRIAWALETFPGRVALASSFGAQSAVSLHLVTRLAPEIPVILVDTGYFFPETYEFIDRLSESLSLNLKVYRAAMSPAWQERRYGKLWEQGLNGIEKYNQINKVEPMRRALAELGVESWLTGLRRQQSKSRENLSVLAVSDGRIKVHPILDWSDKDIFDYLKAHDLPYHPLWEEGYVSIGDWHTTRRLTDGLTPEETRFFGLKRECGLHENADFVI